MEKTKKPFFPMLIVIICWIIGVASLFFQSIRLDESQSLWVATKSIPVILQETAQDVHVPLYEILLHFWVQIFGTQIVAARLLSSIFFLLTLPALYVLVRESSSKKVAYLTLMSFSISPFINWYSNETRMYTLFTFIATLNSIFFLRLIRSVGKTNKFGFFITTLLGFFVHYFFFLITLTQAIYVVGHFVLKMNTKEPNLVYHNGDERYKQFVLTFFLLVLLAGAFFSPWLYYFISSGFAQNTSPLIPKPTGYSVLQTFLAFFVGFQTQWFQAIVISLWPMLILLLFFIFTKREERIAAVNLDYFVLMTIFPVLFTFFVSFFKSIFLARYLIFVTPTFFFLISWALLNNPKRISRFLIAGLLTLMVGLQVYQTAFATSPAREDYAAVASYLHTHAKSQDIIAVSAPFTIYPLEYVYNGPDKIVTIPYWDQYANGPIPPFSQAKLKNQIAEYKKVYARIFVVLSYDQGYQKDIEYYFDTHFKRLDLKNFPPGIQVREYILRYDVDPALLK